MKKRIIFIYLQVFLVLFGCTNLYFPYQSQAQQPSMWHITDEDGLPSLTVYDVFQDIRGFIWLGTEMGLYQFDGKSYKHFQPKNARGRAMSNIQADSEGNIWFSNFSGQLFRWKNDTITESQFVKDLKINNNFSYSIDENDNIWVVWGHLYKYNIKTKKIIDFNEKQKHKDLKNNDLGDFVVSEIDPFRKGLWAFSNKNQIFFIQNDEIKSQSNTPVNVVSFTPLNVTPKYLLLTDRSTNNIYKKKDGGEFELFFSGSEHDNKEILFGRYDTEHNFWICTFSGTYCFDKNLNPIHNKLCILPQNTVSDILVDREGNTWISTLKNGVFILPNKNVLHFNTTNTNLLENTINCVATDEEENLFLGLNNGTIAYFDTKKYKVMHYYDTHRQKDIETLYYDRKNKKLYVGCIYTYIFDKNNFEPINKGVGVSPKSYTIFQNNIISANSNEANAVSLENNAFGEEIPLKTFFKNNKKINDNQYEGGYSKESFVLSNIINKDNTVEVRHLVRLRSLRSRVVWAEHNRFWVAYTDGLFIYENGREKQLLTPENKPILARCFSQTQDSTLWIGTLEQGFFKVFEGKIQAQYNTQNLPQLGSNFIRCMGTDAKHLWLATDKGIVYFEPKTLRARLYDRQDGIMSNEITGIVFKNQQLWLTSTKGIFRLPSRQLPYNTNPPPIYITGVKIWENEVPLIGEYILRHTENNLKIEFQALAYRSRGIFKYKYRMIGVDSTWIYTESTNNFARYPSLLPGKYEFQVRAINEDGVESDSTAILEILILYPFWQKWWFLLAISLLFFGAIFSLYRWQIHHIQKNNEVQKALRESQLSALKVQMNPHFIFNALNSIQEFILLNEKRLANQFLGKFADLMRITLDMSNQKLVKLADEIKLLNLYLELEKVRFEELQYHIEIEEGTDIEALFIPPMLIQPYIENALKHGLLHKKTERCLWVKFYFNTKKKHVLCEIKDNGVGREKSAEYKRNRPNQHKSFATSATQKRLELLNYGRKDTIILQIQDLFDENNHASGTKVILEIPI